MRPLSLLHVIGGGDTGGAMSHLLPLLSALERAGCDVHLVCLGEGGLADAARRRGLSLTVLPMAGARDPRVLRPLRRLLVEGPPPPAQAPARWDIVHTHGMRANLPVRLLAPGLRPRPCLFTTVHSDLGLDYESGRVARVYQGIDRFTAAGVDRIVCVSESLRALLIERGYAAERLLTVYSGLEIDKDEKSSPGEPVPEHLPRTATPRPVAFPVVRPDRTGERSPAGAIPKPVARATPEPVAAPLAAAQSPAGSRDVPPTAPRRPRVGTVARLVAVKDIDLLLEVAGLLHRTHPEVEVVVVGDGPERHRLEALAAGSGAGGSVRFTGRLDDVGPVLRGLDVYMVTSVFEGGVSMSVLEAMKIGLPVVTTAAGGVAEVVVDGETGYVVSRDQERGALAAALAERAAALLADHSLRVRMGGAGAARVRERFTVERTAAQTLRAYERCLAARGTHL